MNHAPFWPTASPGRDLDFKAGSICAAGPASMRAESYCSEVELSLRQDMLERVFAQSILPSAFYAATKLGLYEALTAEAQSVEALSAKLGISLRAAQVLLDAQLLLGLVSKTHAGYHATPEAATFLRSDGEGYCLPIYMDWLTALHEMEMSLRTDLANLDVTSQEYGKRWLHYARKSLVSWPEDAQESMADWSRLIRSGLVRADSNLGYVASGAGVFACALAQFNADCRVTLLDRAEVLVTSREVARRMGVSAQVHAYEYDLFHGAMSTATKLPPVDFLVFRETLHYIRPNDVPTVVDQACALFSSVSGVIVAGSLMSSDRNGPRSSFIDNIYMSVVSPHWGGYSEGELAEHLGKSGFRECHPVGERLLVFTR